MKNPITMKRHELIKELSGHVKHEEISEIMWLPTAVLRGAVVALTAPKHERIAPERPKPVAHEISITLENIEEMLEGSPIKQILDREAGRIAAQIDRDFFEGRECMVDRNGDCFIHRQRDRSLLDRILGR